MPDPEAYPWKIVVRTLDGEQKTFQATEALVRNAQEAPGHCVEINLPGFQHRSILRFCLRGEKVAYFREMGVPREPSDEAPTPKPTG
jgi:hypothetical protein